MAKECSQPDADVSSVLIAFLQMELMRTRLHSLASTLPRQATMPCQ